MGGYNYCSNISNGSCLPNCVGYAWGRWREILGYNPNLSINQAEIWYLKNDGYTRGQEPKLGAVACFSKGDPRDDTDGLGHVCIVEEIYSDGSILTSNSDWNGTRFYTRKMTKPYKIPGQDFQGFIYLPINFEEGGVAKMQYLNLSPSATGWNVYPTDKQPVVGNECGKLNPSAHGGLSYEILRYSMSDVVVINTEEFGEVQIYIAHEYATITDEPLYTNGAIEPVEPIEAAELPIGTMVAYAGTKVPENWLVCNGAEVSRTTYAKLFEIIGTNYGAGNGSTTFNLPDKRGRVSVGLNNNDTNFNALGKKGGHKALQEHNHGFSGTTATSGEHNHTGNTLEVAMKTSDYTRDCARNLSSSADYYNVTITNNAGSHNHTFNGTTANAGTGNAGNLQPYETDNWIIKAKNKG